MAMESTRAGRIIAAWMTKTLSKFSKPLAYTRWQ